MSTRELINEVQGEVGHGDLLPGRASELLNQLSALLGNINDEIRRADLAYSRILLKWLDIETKANRAKITAETTPEYEAKQIARNTKELAIEMIRSLKFYLRAKEEEYRNSRNM